MLLEAAQRGLGLAQLGAHLGVGGGSGAGGVRARGRSRLLGLGARALQLDRASLRAGLAGPLTQPATALAGGLGGEHHLPRLGLGGLLGPVGGRVLLHRAAAGRRRQRAGRQRGGEDRAARAQPGVGSVWYRAFHSA